MNIARIATARLRFNSKKMNIRSNALTAAKSLLHAQNAWPIIHQATAIGTRQPTNVLEQEVNKMENRFKFRAGFTVSFYDIAGNDIERQIILNSCFSIDNGGEGICVNEEIIQEALDIYVAKDEHKSAWDSINAYYAETDGYYFIDNIDFLEQCTGLKDRNGKLIYEGDIVTDNCFNYEIVWDNARARFGVKTGDSIQDINDAKKCAVIGNIRENKELLNG